MCVGRRRYAHRSTIAEAAIWSGTAMRNRPSGQRHDVFMKLTGITVVIRPMWDTPISWGENSDGLCRALEFRVHFFVFGLGSLHLPISILSAQAGVI
ncbi:hypothetical protein V8C44DRAFT_316370 [Trichoderma aethiopicum]